MQIASSEWTADWLWSLPLIAFTLAFHACGLVLIGIAVLKGYARIVRKGDLSSARLAVDATATIALIGVALALLHGLESALWAVGYLVLGAFDSPHDAMLFSLDSMTTRGASGLSPAPHWRMMGAFEAACGVLAFGASTAFLFAAMQALWRALKKSYRAPRRQKAFE
jgi:hypothetical protein